jgi:hypothetical protein
VPEPIDISTGDEPDIDFPTPETTEPDENVAPVVSSGKTGRPRHDGAPPNSKRVRPGSQDPAYSVPNPQFTKYYSDDPNAQKRTLKLWTWVKLLHVSLQSLIDVYVYRDWPPLMPANPEDDDYNNIDKFAATELWARDEDVNDKYGAGDFHVFLNVGVKPHRRTIATAFIKGNRNFRDLPPADKRITQMGEDGFPKYIDRNDPQCKTYVEFLRARGIIPEIYQAEKERMKMEQAQTVTETIGSVERMADKLVKMAEAKATPPAPAPSGTGLGSDTINNLIEASMAGAKASTEILKDTIKTLQEGAGGGGRGGNDATAMLGIALEIADKISKANDATPYLNIISKLNESVMALKMEMLNEKIESLRQPPAPAPAPAPAQSGVGGLKGMIEDFRAIKDLMGDMGGDAAEAVSTATGWAGVVERGLPHIATLGQTLLQMYMASQMRGPGPAGMGQVPQPAPMPRPMPQTPPQAPGLGPVLQMQPLPPAPAPVTQTNGTPQAPGAAPTPDAQAILMNALNTIQVPLSNQLHDGLDGDDFADWFIGGFGEGIYRELTAYGAAALTLGMYSFPPIATRIADLPREQVEKFVQEFCGFDGVEYDSKRERATKEPTPIA